MRISPLITGLLGLARYAYHPPAPSTYPTPTHTVPSSLTSGAVIKTKTGLVISNTTKGANGASCRTGFKMPPIPGGLHGGHGPVVIPDNRCANNSHSRQEANTTTGVTNNTTTKDVNDTSSKIGWPQWLPVIEGGPGPAVIPEDLWKELLIHANDSHSWLVASQSKEHEPLRRGLRVSTEERRAALISKRDGPGDPLPPRDRNLADHMEQHGSILPECYQRCMRQEDGKSSIHMGQVCINPSLPYSHFAKEKRKETKIN